MSKKNSQPVNTPPWYPLKIYEKNISAKELLDEIQKRAFLQQHLTSGITQQQQESSFTKIIIENKLLPISNVLNKVIKRAIKPVSVFEVLNMANQIRRSKWYQEVEDKKILEEALEILAKNQPLSDIQKKTAEKFLNIPWHKFQTHVTTEEWHKLEYSHGISVTIDTGIDRDNIIFELRNLLTNTQGGKKIWSLSPDIFKMWKRKNILAIFDLQTWFSIKKIKFKKTDLSRIIWGSKPPNSPHKDSAVDMKAFIDEAIKESSRAIHMSTIRSLLLYCEVELQQSIS